MDRPPKQRCTIFQANLLTVVKRGQGLHKQLFGWLTDTELRKTSEVSTTLLDVRNYQRHLPLQSGFPVSLVGLRYDGLPQVTLYDKAVIQELETATSTVSNLKTSWNAELAQPVFRCRIPHVVLKTVETLNVSYLKELSSTDAEQVFRHFPSLRHLNLRGTVLHEGAFEAILSTLPRNLETVNVSNTVCFRCTFNFDNLSPTHLRELILGGCGPLKGNEVNSLINILAHAHALEEFHTPAVSFTGSVYFGELLSTVASASRCLKKIVMTEPDIQQDSAYERHLVRLFQECQSLESVGLIFKSDSSGYRVVRQLAQCPSILPELCEFSFDGHVNACVLADISTLVTNCKHLQYLEVCGNRYSVLKDLTTLLNACTSLKRFQLKGRLHHPALLSLLANISLLAHLDELDITDYSEYHHNYSWLTKVTSNIKKLRVSDYDMHRGIDPDMFVTLLCNKTNLKELVLTSSIHYSHIPKWMKNLGRALYKGAGQRLEVIELPRMEARHFRAFLRLLRDGGCPNLKLFRGEFICVDTADKEACNALLPPRANLFHVKLDSSKNTLLCIERVRVTVHH